MKVGTRVKVSDTAGRYAGEEGTIVRLTHSAPIGTKWSNKAQRRQVAELRLDDGSTPRSVFDLSILSAV